MSRPALRRARVASVVVASIASGLAATLVAGPSPAAATGRAAAPAAAPAPAPVGPTVAGAALARRGSSAHAVPAVGRTLGRPAGVAPGAPAESVARAFLSQHGRAFGVRDQARELRVERVRPTAGGGRAVRLRQHLDGVPVVGGELVVATTAAAEVAAVNGETTAARPATLRARVTAAAAAATARAVGLRRGARPAGTVATPVLEFYDPALLGGPTSGPARLVWRTEVRRGTSREFVLVDARTGAVALHFSKDAHVGKDRWVCDANSTAALTCATAARKEGQPATGNSDVDNAYDYSGETYDFFKDKLGRNGIDDKDMQLRSIVRHCPSAADCPYINAYWDGSKMVYGAGFADADDVVAHELGHGVTEHESNLFYWFQSGAINESLSDIYGELVDQAYDHDVRDKDETDAPSWRWILGEDIPGRPDGLRDMEQPNRFEDPDDMADALYFDGIDHTYGTIADNGGVHINSGVNNKAAQLLVDGGTHNGVTVASIGADKTAKLYYGVQNHLTSGADFYDLAQGLKATCAELVTATTLVAEDCTAVDAAIAAVKMTEEPAVAKTLPARDCNWGTAKQAPVFTDGFEDGSTYATRWAEGVGTGVSRWYGNDNPWRYAATGTGSLWGDDPQHSQAAPNVKTDSWVALKNAVTVPATGATPYLRFNSSWSFEKDNNGRYDGGVLEFSTNGGTTWAGMDTLGLPQWRGYNGSISTGFGNPLAGRAAFVGTSNGYTMTRVDLTKLAGRSVKFRFRIGADAQWGDWGWFIDDVEVYSCVAGTTSMQASVSPTVATYPATTKVYGRVFKSGTSTPLPGVTVLLYQRKAGTTAWSYVASALSSAGTAPGWVAFTRTPTSHTEYVMLARGAGYVLGSLSPVRAVSSRAGVTAAFADPTILLGQTAYLRGSVLPTHPGQRVYLDRWTGSAWAPVTSTLLTSSSGYTFAIKPTARGTTGWRVRWSGDADHLAGWSATRGLSAS
jgi:Zn-dependent metalloprotease